MKIKRVVVITDLSDSTGGQEILALLSARLLKDLGIEVIYVCGDHGLSSEVQSLGVEVCAANKSRLLDLPRKQAFRRGLYDAEARAFMDRIVQTYDAPDTVFHLHGWAQIFSPSIFQALMPIAKRTYLHAHDMTLACPNGVYMDFNRSEVCMRRPLSSSCIAAHCDKRSYAQKLWRVVRHSVLARCMKMDAGWAGIIVIHPQMVPMLKRFGYSQDVFRLVRNPVRPYARNRIKAEENEAFLYVGRLEPEKGVVELAEAAKRVGVPLVCVGDGSLRNWLGQNFPNVTLTGKLTSQQISQFAYKSRALVFPSRLPEPFGLVLAEAVHSGLPVAVTRTALMSQEIETGGLGLTFDMQDPFSFDAVLTKFSNMPSAKVLAMSQAGHSGHLRLGLSEEEWVSALIGLYEASVERAALIET